MLNTFGRGCGSGVGICGVPMKTEDAEHLRYQGNVNIGNVTVFQ